MATESNLQKIHVFPNAESYEQNQGSVGTDDIAFLPDVLEGTDYAVYRTRGISLQTSTPSSVPNGCIVGVYST